MKVYIVTEGYQYESSKPKFATVYGIEALEWRLAKQKDNPNCFDYEIYELELQGENNGS